MESPNNLRQRLQSRAAECLRLHKRLIARWATGIGKSNIALCYLKDSPKDKTLIVVPEVNNIENWWSEFDKFNVPKDNVTIICYASLKNYVNTHWDLIVYDEAPHVDTWLRSNIISTISAERVLALGAVVTPEEEKVLQDVYGQFAKTRIGLELGISMGILPPPEVVVCHMTLDNDGKVYMHNGMRCTAAKKYELLDADVSNAVDAYNSSNTTINLRRMQRLGIQRKRFLGEQKEAAISLLCNMLAQQGKRFLCFCSSIKQAETLGKENSFTSKTPKSMDILSKFNNHEIDSIYVVGKLIEGQNLKDVDCGIIGQVGGTERISVQQCGRIMRSAKPIIYVPVFDGTKDESFVETITSSIPSKYVKHYKL